MNEQKPETPLPDLYKGWVPVNFILSADADNAIMEEQGERIGKEIWDDVARAFPDFRMPLSKQAPEEARRMRYVNETDPADYEMLKDPKYFDKYRDHLYPQPISPLWNDLIGVPPAFRFMQKDFIKVMKFLDEDSS